jgi:hypothetical protein
MAEDLSAIIAESMERTGVLLDTEDQVEEKVIEKKEEKKTEQKVEEKKVEKLEDELDDLGLSKSETLQARQLLAALKDPTKAQVVIDHLVKTSGYKAPETKQEVKQVKKALTEQLKDGLGPELAYLADKMGPIFEKFLNEEIEEVQGRNEQRFTDAAIERETQVASVAQSELAEELFGTKELPDDFVKTVSSLLDDYSPKQGQTTKSFLKDMLHLAAGRLGKPITKQVQNRSEKIEKNRNDAGSKLASDGKQPQPGRQVSTSKEEQKPMSLDEAVRIGLEKANAALQMD